MWLIVNIVIHEHLLILLFLSELAWEAILWSFVHLWRSSSQMFKLVNPYRLGFIGIPLHHFNWYLWLARLLWCGSKQKIPVNLPTLKMVRVGSWMNGRSWFASSALIIRRLKMHGSPFVPSAGESLTTQSPRRVDACLGIAPLWSGKRCKLQDGGDVCLRFVESWPC